MPGNIIIDPTSPLYLGVSSNAYTTGQMLANVIFSETETNNPSSPRGQFSKGIRPEYIDLIRKAYGTWKDYKKTLHLLELIRDFGLKNGFYKKTIGEGAKIILKGYAGKREHFKWVIRNFGEGSDLIKFGAKGLTKSALKSVAVEAIFEIAEFAVEYHQADQNKVWGIEDYSPHIRDIAAVGVGGAVAVIAGGVITLASSTVTIPVVVAFLVPVVAGSLAKSGYKWYFDEEMSREDIDKTENRRISNLSFPATFDRPLLSLGPEMKVSNNEIIYDLNAWMELKGFFSPLPTSDRIDFAKQLKLPGH